ncbi:hypothetical protein HZH66_002705 [Vespula vulgaris]|uniref:Uncharacterized protein n=2 Tax=Vespula TaxID=7451 RepID=A0A834NI05_VESVU|nr:hypothetical protein HZH66_002705 [Vespula vulgaris]
MLEVSSNNSSSSSSGSSSTSSTSSGRVGLRCRRPLLRRLRNWRRRGRRKSQGSMSDRFLEARIMHVALCIMRSIGLYRTNSVTWIGHGGLEELDKGTKDNADMSKVQPE